MEGPGASGATRYIIVVSTGETELFKYLHRRFHGDKKVEVILDRRRGERRRGSRSLTPERRLRERRLPNRNGFRSIGLVLIRKRQDGAQ